LSAHETSATPHEWGREKSKFNIINESSLTAAAMRRFSFLLHDRGGKTPHRADLLKNAVTYESWESN
jgi:hypothetical protein